MTKKSDSEKLAKKVADIEKTIAKMKATIAEAQQLKRDYVLLKAKKQKEYLERHK